MNYAVLKTSTQVKPIYKVQNQMVWHSSSAHKLVNDEGNGLPMEVDDALNPVGAGWNFIIVLCYQFISELPSAEISILQSNSSPGVAF